MQAQVSFPDLLSSTLFFAREINDIYDRSMPLTSVASSRKIAQKHGTILGKKEPQNSVDPNELVTFVTKILLTFSRHNGTPVIQQYVTNFVTDYTLGVMRKYWLVPGLQTVSTTRSNTLLSLLGSIPYCEENNKCLNYDTAHSMQNNLKQIILLPQQEHIYTCAN